jgi:hypothetical protein
MIKESPKQETQNGKGNLIKMEFNGVMVAFHGKDEVNLTDLWRAIGSPENKEPRQWVRLPQSIEFIEAVCRKLNVEKSHVLKSSSGKGGGTWANRLIAVSYAGYLSPDLQIWINEVFLDRLQEEHNPDLIAERFISTYRRKGFTDRRIKLRFDSIQSNKTFNEVLSRHGVDKQGHAMCANNINVGVLRVQKKTYLKNNGHDLTEELRNCIPDAQLTAITLAEILSGDKIEKDVISGNHDCAKISFQIAREISNTVERLSS